MNCAQVRRVKGGKPLKNKGRGKRGDKPRLVNSEKRTREIENLILSHRENGRKLARSILRRWRVMMPAEEVDSIVDLTLCEAGQRYSKKKGASFITFLFYHLRGHLVRAVASATSDSNVFMALAASAGVDVNDWSTAHGDGSESVWQLVPELQTSLHRDAESPESMLLKKEKQGVCSDACNRLDDLEREIIERSYVQDEPLVDIARSLGYSRCHISRVKKRALDRLKDHILENSLLEVIDIKGTEIVDEDSHSERVSKRKRRRRITKARGPHYIAAAERAAA